MRKSLKELHFDNQTLKCLPIDPIKENYVRTVKNACFSLVKPSKLKNPKLVCYSSSALQLLDLSEELIDDYFIECFAGNELIPGSEPAAHCYCGHQFGVFAGQLGDGAAIYLGEVLNSKNERWELQLKGAGPTPYSREADGRKVLRSSLREFLCSEAMHNLNIGTTRAAICIVSETKVERDQFYDGYPKMEPCAVISRIAPTFVRFGSFEITRELDPSSGRCGPSVGNHKLLRTMTNFVIKSYFPMIHNSDARPVEKYKLFYKDVVIRTAKLVAQWQAVGFVHGVLNTDNMSILGLTIDYGPFGFIERFDPDHIPNTSDYDGRYRYKKQPEICSWNLSKFAEALNLLVPFDELKLILQEFYYDTYRNKYTDLMLRKFGLFKKVPENLDDENIISDKELINKFLETLDLVGGDYTNCFRKLNLLTIPGLEDFEDSLEKLKNELMKQSSDLYDMKSFYERLLNSPMVYMRLALLRNSQVKLEDRDISILRNLERYQNLNKQDPTTFLEECQNSWNQWLEVYIKRIKFDVKDLEDNNEELIKHDLARKTMLNSTNPRYVLRNHLAQEAIQKAENGDFSEARKLLKALKDPFNENPEFDIYTQKATRSTCSIRISCSS